MREDVQNNIRTKLLYDLSGRLTGIVNSGSRDHKISYGYNEENNVSGITSRVEGVSTASSYTYDRDSRLTASQEGSIKAEISYDVYGRTGSQTIRNGSSTVLTQSIGYVNPDSTHTSLLPGSITNTITGGGTISYSYAYDSKGNITSVTDNAGKTTSYVYDGLSQLVRENNQEAGKTWTYTYDSAGNIREKKEYAYTIGSLGTPADTTTFSYDDATWKDVLTGVNGTTYTTDTIGNLTSDGEWTYTWQHGRQLAGMNKPETDILFTYDAEGIRLSKTVTEGSSTTEYKYYYQDGNLTDVIWGSNRFHIFYDGNGSPVSFTYGGNTYYYVKNLQGDITAITNNSGSIIVKYSYDGWGNPTAVTGSQATTIGIVNPLRYRGYVWDGETGLYYLQSRYYDAARYGWISSDPLIYEGDFDDNAGISGYNIYTYCANNPILYYDDSGTSTQSVIRRIELQMMALVTLLYMSAWACQKAFYNLLVLLADSINTKSKSISGILSSSAKWASKQAKEIAKTVQASFAKAKTMPKYRTLKEEHHITAQRARNASYARKILSKVGIDISSSINMVYIKTGLHRRIHTNQYYGWANSIIIRAYEAAGGNQTQAKINVMGALGKLKAYLNGLDKIAPF